MADTLEKQLVKKRRSKFAPTVATGSLVGSAAGGTTTHIMPGDDVRRVPGQNFLVLSYATPDGTTKVVSPNGMVQKYSGAFATEKDAEAHAQAIRNEDPRFDVFVVDMYKWGFVPLPQDEKPFIRKQYADQMLTRIVGGLQQSMEQGKKEMDERKARDRAKAEAAMQKVKGKDYKMPEKSKLQLEYEERARQAREEEERAAKEGNRESNISYAEKDLVEIVMAYCVERCGTVVDSGTGADMMKFIIAKSIERQALMKKATDREREEDNPNNAPSRDEIVARMEKDGTKPLDELA
jgi:hypothetical protein